MHGFDTEVGLGEFNLGISMFQLLLKVPMILHYGMLINLTTQFSE
jgi:hypothetical protein